MEISQNFVAFSEYTNFTWNLKFWFQVSSISGLSWQKKQIRFLGESMARQSAFGFIWPLVHQINRPNRGKNYNKVRNNHVDYVLPFWILSTVKRCFAHSRVHPHHVLLLSFQQHNILPNKNRGFLVVWFNQDFTLPKMK